MEIGDIVRLKSGGPKMTVTELDEREVTCTWFDRNGRNKTNKFPVATVEAFVAQPPAPEKSDW